MKTKALCFFTSASCLVMLSAVANATSLVCPAPPPPAQAVATVGGGVSSFTYTCDGLIFSNFQVVDAGGTPAGQALDLTGGTYDPSTGLIDLGFNPNASAINTTEDLHIFFEVTGGIDAIDMTLGGANSTATERACTGAFNSVSMLSGTCTSNSSDRQLAVLTDSSNIGTVTSPTFATTSTVYIFKDINVAAGTELTSFSEGFSDAPAAVPEPITFSLMGASLLGIGLGTPETKTIKKNGNRSSRAGGESLRPVFIFLGDPL
jgi:hypothetical protein